MRLKGEAHRAASRCSVSAKVSEGQVWGLTTDGSPWTLLIDRLLAVATRQVRQRDIRLWTLRRGGEGGCCSWAQIASASGRASSCWRATPWLELLSGGHGAQAARTRQRVRDCAWWWMGADVRTNGRCLSARSPGVSELRLCALATRGRLGCSSDQVPAPTFCFGVLHKGWETHKLFPEPGLLGRKQPAALGKHLLPENYPYLCAASASKRGRGVWLQWAGPCTAAGWLAQSPCLSEPWAWAPGQGQGQGASLARVPLDCFTSLRPTPAPLLSACTHPGAWWQRHTVKKSASSCSWVPHPLLFGFWAHPQRLSRVRGWILTIKSDSVRQSLGSRAGAALRAASTLGPWQVSTHFMVSKVVAPLFTLRLLVVNLSKR